MTDIFRVRIGRIRIKGSRKITSRLPKKFAETTQRLMIELGRSR